MLSGLETRLINRNIRDKREMTIFSIDLKELADDIVSVSWSLFRVMIPTLIVVKIAQDLGAVDILDIWLQPITEFIGLPAALSIVLTTTMLTNPYAGLIVLASIDMISDLSVAETSILASFMLFAHALPVEAVISRQAGTKIIFVVCLRVLTAVIFCFLLNQVLTSFDLLQHKALIHLPEFQVTPSWFEWSVDQVKGLIFIQIVIIALLTALAILKIVGIERLIALCMRPFLNLIKIDENASTIMVVGLTLGLGFGGGLMIKEVKAGHVNKMQALSALVFINLFHSVFEDTALMMLLGPSLLVILVLRFLFCVLVAFLLIMAFRILAWPIVEWACVNSKSFPSTANGHPDREAIF